MGSPNLVPIPHPDDKLGVVRAIRKLASLRLNQDASPTFASLTLTGSLTVDSISITSDLVVGGGVTIGDLTASRLLFGDGSKIVDSVENLESWIAGTANQIITADDSDGSITLSTPQDIHTGASPTWVGTTLTGKLDAGSQVSPIDVTNTRQYGFELHYSGNNYSVTGIRSRAQLVTTDTAASAIGGLFQAANNDNINAGVLMGFMAEAIGKTTANASTITTMRGGLIGTEWGALDTVTNLMTLHLRGHSLNAAGAGSFGTGYALYIENEAVGGNGQAYDAGIYFKGTNLSAGNKAFTYGIDFSGGTCGTADIRLQNGEIIENVVDETIGFGSANLVTTGGLTVDTDTLVVDEVNHTVNGAVFFGDANNNMSFGNSSTLSSLTSGTNNIAIGGFALGDNEDGLNNLCIGYKAGLSHVSSDENVFIGYKSGAGESSAPTLAAKQNVAIGSYTCGWDTLTSGGNNMCFGRFAGARLTSGQGNVLIGSASGEMLTTESSNIFLGGGAGEKGQFNICIGSSAGGSLTSNGNAIVGFQAAKSITSSGENAVLGFWSMFTATTAAHNVSVGSRAGYSATTGDGNIFLGYYSGYNQTTNSNLLIIDNQDRTNVAGELANSLMYGVFAAAAADQSLRINGEILGSDGAKIGDGGATNYTQFSATGVQTMVGDARVMISVDLEPVLATRPVANPPGEGEEGGFSTHDFNASTDESVFFHFELGHDYADAGLIHIHFDFFVDTAEAGATSVVWGVEYKKQSIGDNFGFSSGTTTAYTQISVTSGTPANDKKVHQSAEVNLTTTGFVAGDYLLLRLFRDASGTGGTDDFPRDARIIDYHVEYLSDKLGEAL